MAKPKKTKKPTQKPWFRSVRGSYLPRAWQGFAIYLVYCAYLVIVPISWYAEGHDLWQFLTRLVPLELAAAAATQYIAAVHSRPAK